MNFLLENWIEISAFVFGSGGIGGVIGWVLKDKEINEQLIKKGSVEILKEDVDLAKDTRDYFKLIIADITDDREVLKNELKTAKEDAKSERDLFLKRLSEIEETCNSLEDKIDNNELKYALEVEKSEHWEKQHKILEGKYNKLQKFCDDLKAEINKLKSNKI